MDVEVTLLNRLVAFEKATDGFRNCPERFVSGPVSAGAREIIDHFFRLEKELSKIGLELETKRQWPAKAAVYRWAVWTQAASHTASLLCASRNFDNAGWPDSADIMKHLGVASDAMFAALDKERG